MSAGRAAARAKASLPIARLVRTPAGRETLGPNTTIIPVLLDDPISYLLDRWTDAETDEVFFVPAFGDGAVHLFRITRVDIPSEATP